MAEQTQTDNSISYLYIPFPSKNDYNIDSSIGSENGENTYDAFKTYGEDYVNPEKLDAIDKGFSIPSNESLSNYLLFDLPDWGVENYISDRDKWIKGKRSIADEPGWFYFKVFFKFNTNFGLFGGVLDENKLMKSTCALRYLNNIKSLYKAEQIPMRINALGKFVSILSQINTKYPWIIKGVGGLEKIMNPYTENFDNGDKNIQLTFNVESTDMKVINMLNYYKLACYDDINCKEIIPENLRKFDMMIVFYHIPIKYFQTAIMVAPKRDLTTGITKPGTKWAKAEEIINKTINFLTTKSTYYKYKRMMPENNDYSNMMSFNMFTFNNCEFDANSFGKYYSSEISNDSPFQFQNTTINIKYERVYYHTMNEWSQTFFGSDGFYYDPNFPSGSTLPDSRIDMIRDVKSNSFANRLKSLKEARAGSTFFDKNAEQYKSLIDFSESVITDGLMNMKMKNYYSFLDGNLYGGKIGVDSEYFDAKMKILSDGAVSGNLYGDIGISRDRNDNVIKSEYFGKKLDILKNGVISGNLYGDVGPKKSEKMRPKNYFDEKLERLKSGTIFGNIFTGKADKKYKSYFEKKLKGLKEGTIRHIPTHLIVTKSGKKIWTTPGYKDAISRKGELAYDSSNAETGLYKELKQEIQNDLKGLLISEKDKYKYDSNVELENLKNFGINKNNLSIDAAEKQSLDTIKKSSSENKKLTIDQVKKQKVDIVQYLSGNLGSLDEKSLTSGIKDKINKASSFFKMSKNDW